MRLTRQASLLVLIAAATAHADYVYPNCASGKLSSNKICDSTLSRAERAAALIEAMTPQEKLDNLLRLADGASRIGLPNYNYWNEALHGVAASPNVSFSDKPPFNAATQFPMPILMASAFDDELIKEIGTVIGTEARAWANHGFSGIDYWTPNVNPYRDPRWGRGAETPGEDAIRVSRYAKAMVEGLEGDGQERRVIATCKHYAANDFEVFHGVTRHNFDALVTMQDLAEYYLLPFQQCARDSKVGSVMCAYNRVNGAPSCASDYLLNTVLRHHWKWTDTNNFVTSDCGAIKDIYLRHNYTETNAEGTALSFVNGCDTLCEETWTADIPGAWEQGLLSEEIVDRALQRLYEGLIQGGYFAGDESQWAHLNWGHVNTPKAQALALQSAVDSIVLPKNDDDTLPLSLRPEAELAFIGFWADSEKDLYGDYSGTPPYSYTPARAARDMGYSIHIAGGPVLQGDNDHDNWTEPALEAAKKSDYIVYFGGLDRSASSEENDRYSLAWPEAQATLLKTLAGLDKPVIVVQLGDQVDNTELLQLSGIKSILWASWPGQDGGRAIMKLITGEESPAGRLPVTQYPAKYAEQLPPMSMSLRPTSKYPGRTYRWYDEAVQPFGYGLHYTTFKTDFTGFPETVNIQDLVSECSNEHPDTCAFPSLQVRVKNTGSRKSDYVALAFLQGDVGIKPYPLKTLATYTRLRNIKPGDTVTAELNWSLGEVARHDDKGNTVLYPGDYKILLDEPTRAEMHFTLTGEAVVLDEWPADPSIDGRDEADESGTIGEL